MIRAPRVWIVPVNFNGLEDTRMCLRSLAELSTPASVVVVDNASKDDPTAILKDEFPWTHLIRNPVNTGWSGGNNAGIRFALQRGADFVILLNNDTTVHPELVARLVAAADAHPEFGIIGPVIRTIPSASCPSRNRRRQYQSCAVGGAATAALRVKDCPWLMARPACAGRVPPPCATRARTP